MLDIAGDEAPGRAPSGLVKAMVIAECIESQRLWRIIREFQHHRFGRWAESLPEE